MNEEFLTCFICVNEIGLFNLNGVSPFTFISDVNCLLTVLDKFVYKQNHEHVVTNETGCCFSLCPFCTNLQPVRNNT